MALLPEDVEFLSRTRVAPPNYGADIAGLIKPFLELNEFRRLEAEKNRAATGQQAEVMNELARRGGVPGFTDQPEVPAEYKSEMLPPEPAPWTPEEEGLASQLARDEEISKRFGMKRADLPEEYGPAEAPPPRERKTLVKAATPAMPARLSFKGSKARDLEAMNEPLKILATTGVQERGQDIRLQIAREQAMSRQKLDAVKQQFIQLRYSNKVNDQDFKALSLRYSKAESAITAADRDLTEMAAMIAPEMLKLPKYANQWNALEARRNAAQEDLSYLSEELRRFEAGERTSPLRNVSGSTLMVGDRKTGEVRSAQGTKPAASPTVAPSPAKPPEGTSGNGRGRAKAIAEAKALYQEISKAASSSPAMDAKAQRYQTLVKKYRIKKGEVGL